MLQVLILYNVSDANGCTASCSVTITEPAALVATCSVVSNVTCNGGSDGAADVTVSGGTAPHSGTGSFTGLAAGSYTFTMYLTRTVAQLPVR